MFGGARQGQEAGENRLMNLSRSGRLFGNDPCDHRSDNELTKRGNSAVNGHLMLHNPGKKNAEKGEERNGQRRLRRQRRLDVVLPAEFERIHFGGLQPGRQQESTWKHRGARVSC